MNTTNTFHTFSSPPSFSKTKRSKNEQLDEFIFPDKFCQEIWVTNVRVKNQCKNKVTTRIYLIELHCYDGYCMLKFYPKYLRNSKDKFKLRAEEIVSNVHFSEFRRLIRRCGEIMSYYLSLFPENYIGYIGQTDSKDNRPSSNRLNSQRYSIYEVFVNSFFRRPKYMILNNKFNEFNIKLIRLTHNKRNGAERTRLQIEHYRNFKHHFQDLDKSLIISFMTKKQLLEYHKDKTS